MNADLAKTLDDLGPEYAEFVRALRRSREVEPSGAVTIAPPRVWRRWTWRHLAAAASLAALLASLPVIIDGARGPRPAPGGEASASAYTLALAGDGHVPVDELVRTQNADGSWANDYLTRQNAAALRGVGEANTAYRRALRYLRAKGLAPLTEDELTERRAMVKS